MGGGKGGGGGGDDEIKIDFDAEPYINRSILELDDALRAALPYTEGYMYESIATQKEAQREAQLQLKLSSDLARADIKEYFERAMAYGAPYREAGYKALDSLQDILGQPRMAMGSSALAKALENDAKIKGAREQMAANGRDLANRLDLSPQDRQNLLYMTAAGLNPMGIQQALSEIGAQPITRAGPREIKATAGEAQGPTDISNRGKGRSGGSGGTPGVEFNMDPFNPSLRANIPGLFGNRGGNNGDPRQNPYNDMYKNSNATLQSLYDMTQRLALNPVTQYVGSSMGPYSQMTQAQNNMSPDLYSALRAVQSGYAGMVPVPTSVYNG